MAKAVTPSKKEMTNGQIDKAVGVYRTALEKHRSEFGSEAVQQALGADGFASELLAVFRRRVEVFSNQIVRLVSVNRNRTPKEMLVATGRNQYVDDGVVKIMPKGEGDKAEVIFFKLGRYISDTDLSKEYESRGLKPADPYSLGAVNEADPAFADSHPNGTHWQDANGKWCLAAFVRWGGGERDVSVDRHEVVWSGGWWFAGLRK